MKLVPMLLWRALLVIFVLMEITLSHKVSIFIMHTVLWGQMGIANRHLTRNITISPCFYAYIFIPYFFIIFLTLKILNSRIPGQSTCTRCEAGSKCSGGVKIECSPGTYAPEGSGVCFPCEAGTLAPSPGTVTCEECEEGHMCNTTTSTPCSAGHYAPGRSTVCSECPGGSYAPSSGAVSCLGCPGGFQCTESEKIVCGEGYFSPEFSSQCSLCLDGTYSNETGLISLVILSIYSGIGFILIIELSFLFDTLFLKWQGRPMKVSCKQL